MFRDTITSTPFTTEMANATMGSRISGDSYNGDVSFLATIRALVYPRLGEDEGIYFSVCCNANRAENRIPINVEPLGAGYFQFYKFCHYSTNENEKWLSYIDDNFVKENPDWIKLEKITDYFRKKANVICFVNVELKQTILFTDNIDMRRYHALQTALFAYLPWYFDPHVKNIKEIEVDLIRALAKNTPDEYQRVLSEIVKQYDFKTEFVKSKLRGIENAYERKEQERVRSKINNVIQDINNLNDRISSDLREKRDLEIRLLGLEQKISMNGDDSEILSYFLANDCVSLIDAYDTTITFAIRNYATLWDEDNAESVIGNRYGYLYSVGSTFSDDDMELLLRAIFIDRKLRIRFCAAYTIQIGERVSAIGDFNYGCEFSDCTPNPHIDQYRCMGDYIRTINEALSENNPIFAIENCVASCASINFGDSAVMSEFARRIHGNSKKVGKCIELPDGTLVDPKGAIEYLKGENVVE